MMVMILLLLYLLIEPMSVGGILRLWVQAPVTLTCVAYVGVHS